jgi:hypothetical protein
MTEMKNEAIHLASVMQFSVLRSATRRHNPRMMLSLVRIAAVAI